MPEGKELTNSIGMRLVRIEPGVFRMGAGRRTLPPESDPLRKSSMKGPPRLEGDFDERPSHRVEITRRFYMAATEVTNAQYEQLDPSHAELRGKLGFSKEDDESGRVRSLAGGYGFLQVAYRKGRTSLSLTH